MRLVRNKPGPRYPLPSVPPAGVIGDAKRTIVTSYQLDSGRYLLRWRHFDFLIDAQGQWVVCYSDDGAPDEVIWLLLSGIVASFVLMLRGIVAVHGSGVALDKDAVCFVGFPGSGKSTIAAALARRGACWLADDTTAVELSDSDAIVRPSHPTVKLREDAFNYFRLPRKGTIKEEVPIGTAGIPAAAGRYRLRTIYRLDSHRESSRRLVAEVIDGASRVVELLPYVRAAALAPGSLRGNLLNRCGRLLQAVRVAEFHYPHGLENLPAICDFLVEDIRRAR